MTFIYKYVDHNFLDLYNMPKVKLLVAKKSGFGYKLWSMYFMDDDEVVIEGQASLRNEALDGLLDAVAEAVGRAMDGETAGLRM
jgi:hypothetical protein